MGIGEGRTMMGRMGGGENDDGKDGWRGGIFWTRVVVVLIRSRMLG
jgi:hypothetical protein